MVLVVLVGIAGLSVVGWVAATAASAPAITTLKERDPGSNTEVLAADGTRLGFISADELSRPVDGDRMPQVLKDATVAIEDERFYRHQGVDYEGIVRAAVKNFMNRETVEGGSTLTMQLVKNLYTADRTREGLAGYQRKIREAKLAEELENEHSKEWLLTKYLNTTPYGTVGGQTAIGAEAAARVYFNKRAKQLDLHEAALLAGLPQAPSAYSPIKNGPGRQAPPQRGAGEDGRAGHGHRPAGAAGDAARARPQPVRLLQPPPRELLLRLRQGRADQAVRPAHGQARRPRRPYDDRPRHAAQGARGDRVPARRHRAVVGAGDDGPAQRLHPRHGLVGRLRGLEVQPRRPGRAPARLVVQDDGADDRAAQRRRPGQHPLHVGVADPDQRPPLRPAVRDQDLRRHQRRQHEPRPGHDPVRQLGLHPARARPRARQGGRHGGRDGHPPRARARLPGGVARRARGGRVAARDGDRLRDDRIRRLPQPADRHHQGDVPERQVAASAALEGQAHEGVQRRA